VDQHQLKARQRDDQENNLAKNQIEILLTVTRNFKVTYKFYQQNHLKLLLKITIR